MTDSPEPKANVSPGKPQPPKRRSILGISLLILGGILIVLFIGIQFIPVNRTNPPVTTQLNWDSPQTKALAYRACMDCHSNETTWPWYSYIAPVSWLTYYDVVRGRSQLNFSTISATGGERQGNPFGQPSGDLAYRLGQLLAGGGEGRGPGGRQFEGRPPGGAPEGGQFPTPAPGQERRQFPGGGERSGGQITENIQNNRMPPANYLLTHPTAKLSDAEKQQLAQGLMKTLGLSSQGQ